MKKLLAAVLGYAIILLLVLAVLVPLTFLCGGLMRLLGFTYDSPGSFLLFFVICAVCGFPLEIFSKAFPKAMRTLGLLGARGEKILFLILDAASTTVVMLVIDDLMDSVHATNLSILAVAIALAFLSLDNREKQKPTESAHNQKSPSTLWKGIC